MKKSTLLIFVFALIAQFATAQMAQSGNLTVYSEDGAKFYLELNGQRYNDKAQAKVRIEKLPNPYYDCKIIFEGNKKTPIEKKKLMIADDNGRLQNVTYNIRKKKNGTRSLNLYAVTPMQQNMQRPSNCATYAYGNPRQMIVGPDGTIYAPVGQQGVPPFQVGVYAGEMGAGVIMPGQGNGTTVTTTTTTTTTVGGNYGGYPPRGNHNEPNWPGNTSNNNNEPNYDTNAGPCRRAMNPTDFEQAKAAIKDNKFDDTKLSTTQEIISANCVTASQILDLIKLFSFEENKLEVAKFAYEYCIDKNNYFKVGNAFSFEHSKTELNDYIRQQR